MRAAPRFTSTECTYTYCVFCTSPYYPMVSSEAVLQFVFVASRIWRKGPRVAPWARGAGRGARGAGRQSCFCIAVSPYTDIFAGVVSFGYPAPHSTHLCISKSLFLYISVSPYLRWRCKSRLPVSSPYARDSSLIKQQTDTCGRWLMIWVTAAV